MIFKFLGLNVEKGYLELVQHAKIWSYKYQ